MLRSKRYYGRVARVFERRDEVETDKAQDSTHIKQFLMEIINIKAPRDQPLAQGMPEARGATEPY